MALPLSVGRPRSVKSLETAMAGDHLVFLLTQRNPQTEDPARENLYEVGTVGEVLQMMRMPDGSVKLLVEGVSRARLLDFNLLGDGYVRVDIQPMEEPAVLSAQTEALARQCRTLFEQYVKMNKRMTTEHLAPLAQMDDPARLADTVAGQLPVKLTQRQEILEIVDVAARLDKLVQVLNSEIEILNLERKIQSRVRTQIEKTQKEYYLTEQIKAIQKELKQKDDFARELDEFRQKIKKARMPKEVQAAADNELGRLEKMMPYSPEATVARTYLDWLIGLPWAVSTKDQLDIRRAEKILNEDHYGLDKAKERVLEYLAVLKRVKRIKGPILCFVGPPGVGKTSLGRSIARSLGRQFVRLSLGGVRDEAEIRGHRRTYIGSLPGRIIQGLRRAKSRNPVFLLDEIDKMGTDWRGDPAAALLEVLDPEQNHTFTDHYLDVEFDLSDVLFVTTANTLYSIPPSLQDRLEILRFPGYTMAEKTAIAKQYLIPKQWKEHGLKSGEVTLEDGALDILIKDYTQEAGVRNLERQLASVARKAAKRLAVKATRRVVISRNEIGKFLGVPEYHREKASANSVGVATGLAWTEHGGETLSVEVKVMPGKGKLVLTGKLGDVMQESAQAALSYVRSVSRSLRLPKTKASFRDRDMHIHIPEGAIPKDGPSAGIAMATAVASVLTGRPVRKNMAMTGEITLSGRVLPIGGLKEKVLAAHREGLDMVIFPDGNKRDLEDIPENIRKEIELVPVRDMRDVFRRAFNIR